MDLDIGEFSFSQSLILKPVFSAVPGRSPISVAAAAIYMASQASDDKKTQKDIAEIAGVAGK